VGERSNTKVRGATKIPTPICLYLSGELRSAQLFHIAALGNAAEVLYPGDARQNSIRGCPTPRAGAPRFSTRGAGGAVALCEQSACITQTLVDILQRDESLTLLPPINVHTLTAHLCRRGKTRRLLGQSTQVYQRFERDQVNALWQGDAMTTANYLTLGCFCHKLIV
jgi:hypothetical protein